MKPFEACTLLFFIIVIGMLCNIGNTLEQIKKNTALAITQTQEQKEISPPYATSIIMGKEML